MRRAERFTATRTTSTTTKMMAERALISGLIRLRTIAPMVTGRVWEVAELTK